MIEAVLFDWHGTLVADAGDEEGPAVLASAQALLEALHDRGIRTGVVAGSASAVTAAGLDAHLDLVVGDEGLERAVADLAVEPFATMFVGDDLGDVQEAANLGMTTVQALWFRADETSEVEPDFMAFTPMDVLNAARRLAL